MKHHIMTLVLAFLMSHRHLQPSHPEAHAPTWEEVAAEYDKHPFHHYPYGRKTASMYPSSSRVGKSHQ